MAADGHLGMLSRVTLASAELSCSAVVSRVVVFMADFCALLHVEQNSACSVHIFLNGPLFWFVL